MILKRFRYIFGAAFALCLLGTLTLLNTTSRQQTVSAVGNCPGNEVQGDASKPDHNDPSKCYLPVSAGSTGGLTYQETSDKPTSDQLPDQPGDVAACPDGSIAGAANSQVPGATDPRTCYDPKQGGLGTPKQVAHLTQAGAQQAIDSKNTTAFKDANGNSVATGGGCSDGATQDANGNCENSTDTVLSCGGGALDWVVCPVITLAQGAAQQVDQFITSQLNVDVKPIFDTTTTPGSGYYKAWSAFRVIATALLVIGGLFMVVSSALGFEFLDAYTIRKVLPRILVAVIGISLSWPLMEFVVRFFDTVGLDIRSLIYAPFKNLGGTIDVSVGIASYFAAGAAVIALGFASLTLVLTALLALFVGFIVLVVRQLAIVVIIILAPVAIACYILPNTQKVWKIWKDNFLGLMLMFPIISAFIAAGHVFAAVAISSPNTTGITQIVGIVAYFVPYFLLPVAFRLATGIIGNIAGVVNDRNRGMFDRLKKSRQNTMANRFQRAKAGNLYQGEGRLARGASRLAQTATLAPQAGLNPGKMRTRLEAARATSNFDQAMEASEKNADMRAIIQDDDVLSAGKRGTKFKDGTRSRGTEADAVRYLQENTDKTDAEIQQSLAMIRRAKRAVGDEAFQVASTVAIAGTGTGYKDGGPQEMFDAIRESSNGDMALAGRMYAAARSNAGRAGRGDLANYGFGAGIGALNESMRTGTSITDEQNDQLKLDAFNSMDTNTLGRQRKEAISNMGGAVSKRMADLHSRFDSLNQDERYELGKLTANLENARDSFKVFAAPQKVDALAPHMESTSVIRGDDSHVRGGAVGSVRYEATNEPLVYNVQTRVQSQPRPVSQGLNDHNAGRGRNPADPRYQQDEDH